MSPLSRFRELWATDFEFIPHNNGRLEVVCMVARELRSGRLLRLWANELGDAPFGGPSVAMVAFFAPAESGCFIELGWPLPEIIDLFSVHRVATNGATNLGNSLVEALAQWGCPGIDAEEKDDMRRLVLRGGPWSSDERVAILDYCQRDVDALGPLLAAMEPVFAHDQASLAQELLRGEYMAAVAGMERTGIPLDTERLELILGRREELMSRLIVEVDPAFRVYEGATFKSARFFDYLRREGLPWPRGPDGRPKLDDDTFKDMARRFPGVEPLRQLRKTLSTLRSIKLAVGHDGRARCMLSPLASKTGRNQPSNSRFIFGMPKWMRSLVTPAPGTALAYIDYATQEVGIAAALSADGALWEAYCSGDVYLAFAKQAKLAPPEATKQSHKSIRDQCKAIVLGVQYGQEAEGMAMKAGISVSRAHELLARHRRTYRAFWEFNRLAVANGMAGYPVTLALGWRIRQGQTTDEVHPNPRSFGNFPVQGTGSEILRAACVAARREGHRLVAPVHDALLVEVPGYATEARAREVADLMAEASAMVLSGYPLRTEVAVIPFGSRLIAEERPRDGSATMWERVCAMLGVAA